MTLGQKLQAFAAESKNKETQSSAASSRAKQKKIVLYKISLKGPVI